MKLHYIPISSLLVLFIWVTAAYSLPAFPGAEGMGASATGARGHSSPSVYVVTNTNDSGPGSLREGVTGPGKDGTYVVFATSGIINLQSHLQVESSYITIAGETSPGGICLAGDEFRIGSSSNYGFHDIIIRHVRFRSGDYNCTPDCDTEHSLLIYKSHDIIVDHCSFTWGVDETVSVTTYTNASAYNIVFSWCIFGEGLTDAAPEDDHGYAFLFNGTYSDSPRNTITFHHNYFVSCNARMPQLSGFIDTDFRNNVIYNWFKSNGATIYVQNEYRPTINFVNNYIKPGPVSNDCDPDSNSFDMQIRQSGQRQSCPTVEPFEAVYVKGNRGCSSDTAGCGYSGNEVHAGFYRSTPFEVTDIPVTTRSMNISYAEEILQTVGASRPFRDDVDARLVADFSAGTGSLKATTTFPDDWPTYQTPAPPVDSDNDGMRDAWEIKTFGDLSKSAVGDEDSDGYHNIEEYFHYLAGTTPTPIPGRPTNLHIDAGFSII